jgi:hypothetical protein
MHEILNTRPAEQPSHRGSTDVCRHNPRFRRESVSRSKHMYGSSSSGIVSFVHLSHCFAFLLGCSRPNNSLYPSPSASGPKAVSLSDLRVPCPGSTGWVYGPPGAYNRPSGPNGISPVPYGLRTFGASARRTKSDFTGDREDRAAFFFKELRRRKDIVNEAWIGRIGQGLDRW